MAGGRLMLVRRARGAGRRRVRRAQYGGRRKSPHLKGFSKVQARSIVKAIGRKEETKYMATQLALNLALDAAIHTPGTDVLPLVPAIHQGTGESNRVGRKVTPTKSYVDVTATFNQSGSPPAIATAREIYVVMYLLKSKVYKNWQQWLAAPSPQTNYLLDDGAGNSVPFGTNDPSLGYTSNTSFLQYPVDQSEFTLLKKRIVKLVRNDGFMNGTPGGATQPNLPQSSWSGRFYFKLPKLLYDDSAAIQGGYPTNACVMMAVGYANADNATTIVPDGYNALSITARAHWWFKDA